MTVVLGFDEVEPLGPTEVRLSPRRRTTVIRDVREACATIRPHEAVAWDLETGGLDPWRAPIAVVSLYGAESQVPCVLHVRGWLPDELRRLMASPRLWVGHNTTCFDRLFLEQVGIDTFAPGVEHYDTLVGEGVAKTSGRRDVRVNLAATINRRLGRKITKNADHNSWMNPDLDADQLAYCVDDVMALHRVREEQVAKVAEEGRSGALELEQELCDVTCAMILTGLPLDRDALAAWHAESLARMAEAGEYLRRVVGRPFVEDLPPGAPAKVRATAFNVGSPPQLKAFIAETFGVEVPDTQRPTLEGIAEIDNDLGAFAKAVLTWRPGKKRTSMYDEAWLAKFVQPDGRLHGRFWQLGTETGRFSSTDPNLEQWPRDGRKVIGGEPGTRIVSADYDAIEVMIAAALARDPQLLADCTRDDEHDGDPHLALAGFMSSTPTDQITRDQRRLAKAANFTLLFGGGLSRFHDQCRLGDRSISRDVTQRYYDEYLRRYEGVARMRYAARRMANQQVAVLDFPTGLRRVVAGGECRPTILINNAVQGTAAAGIKWGMLELHRRGLARHYLGSMVHDELVSVVPEEEADEYAHELEDAMVTGMRKAVPTAPVRATAKVGTHWS